MGGCRCSYRSCKVRSDGQTHMFHFPVFNKMRCHQWITNALKPNFLNLKLSQLRNRVICQHHFKDNNFMNFKRDKLKSDAVPTEDGPYSVSDPIPTNITEENDKQIPINADDIENDILNSVEKKAHSSVKYGDFLISDVTELFNATHNSIDTQVSQKKVLSQRNPVKSTTKLVNDNAIDYKSQNREENNKYTINYTNEDQMLVKAVSPSKSAQNPECPSKGAPNPEPPSKGAPNSTGVAIEYEETVNPNKSVESVRRTKKLECFNSTTHKPDKIVTIISEKKISEPVVVGGKLEPISPSMIIRPKKLKSRLVFEQNDWVTKQEQNEKSCMEVNLQASVNNNVIPQDQTIIFEQTLPIEYVPEAAETNPIIYQNSRHDQLNINEEKQNPLSIINLNNIENHINLNDGIEKQNDHSNAILKNNVSIPIKPLLLSIKKGDKKAPCEKPKPAITPVSTPVYKSVLRSKITPEKLAAIEQKRKFNMKLKDVITSCLDNLEEPNGAIDKRIIHDRRQTVKRSLLKNSTLAPIPSQGSMIAYLEARLQKMEDTLLNKIDLNTQRINELKRTIKPSSNARNANTQTYLNHMSEDSQKQYLYKEISRFLSPNANIKIYEELFMNKSSQEEIETTPRKLPRRR